MPRTTLPKYEVGIVGWENENPITPIVLLSLRERTKLDVKVGQPVKVKKGRKTAIAIVNVQFKQCVGTENLCSLNSKLATSIEFASGETVKLDKAVTESEYSAFQESQTQAIRNDLQSMLFPDRNQPTVEGDGAE